VPQQTTHDCAICCAAALSGCAYRHAWIRRRDPAAGWSRGLDAAELAGLLQALTDQAWEFWDLAGQYALWEWVPAYPPLALAIEHPRDSARRAHWVGLAGRFVYDGAQDGRLAIEAYAGADWRVRWLVCRRRDA
jgi:hypothetical protein